MAVTSTITVEQSPPSPSQVKVSARSTTDHPGARIVDETLTVIGQTSGLNQQWKRPIPPMLDLSAFVGESVTVRYTASDNSGGEPSDFVEGTTSVPEYASPEITVDLGLPREGANYHSLQEGIAATPTGGLLTIYGNHTLWEGVNPQDLTLAGKSAITIRGNTPSVTIDGNALVATRNVALIFSTGNRCTLKDITFTNGRMTCIGLTQSTQDAYLVNVICNGQGAVLPSGDGPLRGIQAYGTTIFPDNLVIYKCVCSDWNVGGSTVFSGNRGTGIEIRDGALNTWVGACTCERNGSENYLAVGLRKGGTHVWIGNKASNSGRSNMIVQKAWDVIIEENEIIESNAAGVQVENDCGRVAVRFNKYIRNQRHVDLGGECATWVDDSFDVVVEGNVYGFDEDGTPNTAGNWVGIRVDGDLDTDTEREGEMVEVISQRVQVRNNIITACGRNPIGRAVGSLGIMNWQNASHVYNYNNTCHDNGRDESPVGGTMHNGIYSNTAGNTGNQITEHVYFVNNIIDTVRNWQTQSNTLWLSKGGDETNRWDNNIYWKGPTATPYRLDETNYDWTEYKAAVFPNEDNSEEADPLLDPATMLPTEDSPARYAGAPLATIQAINENVLTLDYPHVFHVPIGLGEDQLRDRIVFANGEFAYVAAVSGTTVTVDQLPGGVLVGQTVTAWGCENIGVGTPAAHEAQSRWGDYRNRLPKGYGAAGERPIGDDSIQYGLRSGHRLFATTGREVPTMNEGGVLIATRYADNPTDDDNSVAAWRENVPQVVDHSYFRSKVDYRIEFDFELRPGEYNPSLFIGRILQIHPGVVPGWNDSSGLFTIKLDRLVSGQLDLRCRLRGQTDPNPLAQFGANHDLDALLRPFSPGFHHFEIDLRWDWEADGPSSYARVTHNNMLLLDVRQPLGWNYSESSEPNAARIAFGWQGLTETVGTLARFSRLEIREV